MTRARREILRERADIFRQAADSADSEAERNELRHLAALCEAMISELHGEPEHDQSSRFRN